MTLTDDYLKAAGGERRPDPSQGVYTPRAGSALLHTPPDLASDQHILDRSARALARRGVVGEDRAAKLVYLGLSSRVLDEPISMAVKGLSSSGKSYVIDRTLGSWTVLSGRTDSGW